MKRALATAAAGLIVVGWALLSLFLVVAASLMSVDEESQGWSDVLLNPYVVGPYLLLTGLGATVVWFLLRPSRVRL